MELEKINANQNPKANMEQVRRFVGNNTAAVTRAEPQAQTTETQPQARHIVHFLGLLQSHFPVASDSRRWDKYDTVDYGKQSARLTPKQTGELFSLLRERHTFRPSVADVKKAADEIAEKYSTLPDSSMTGAQSDAYRPFTLPVPDRTAIAGRTTEDAIADAKAKVEALKREKPLPSEPSPAPPVPVVVPVRVPEADTDKAALIKKQRAAMLAELEAEREAVTA